MLKGNMRAFDQVRSSSIFFTSGRSDPIFLIEWNMDTFFFLDVHFRLSIYLESRIGGFMRAESVSFVLFWVGSGYRSGSYPVNNPDPLLWLEGS